MADEKTDFGVQSENSYRHYNLNAFEPISLMVQRHMANARERNRTTSVNVAFSVLRTCIPTEPRDRKLSKVETLRLATSYIGHLSNVVKARSEGDFEGEVCKRYGCVFSAKETSSNVKRICTFCFADSKRSPQLLWTELKDNKNTTAACKAERQKPIPKQTNTSNIYTYELYNRFVAKEMEERAHHYSQCIVKEEMDV